MSATPSEVNGHTEVVVDAVTEERVQQVNELLQKRNVVQVPTDEQVIVPGAIEQLIVKPSMSGTLLAIVVGPMARVRKLFAGKQALDVPEDVQAWRPNAPIKAGSFVIMTVENVGDEPMVFRGLLLIDAPGHTVVVGEPQAPPPVTEYNHVSRYPTQAAAPGPMQPKPMPHIATRPAPQSLAQSQAQSPMAARVAANAAYGQPGLTQALRPEPVTTPADHGARAGANEVAFVFLRNDAQQLLNHLRAGYPLDATCKHTMILRLDSVLKVKR